MTARVLRYFDGIAYSAIVLLALLLYPSAGRDALGRISMIVMLPVIVGVWCGLSIPSDLVDTPAWRGCKRGLTLSGLAFAALAPFIPWWYLTPDSTYLFFNAIAAIYMGVLFLHHVNLAVCHLARAHDDENLAQTAYLFKHAIIYIVFCTFSAMAVAVIVQVTMLRQPPFAALANLFSIPAVRPGLHAVIGIWVGIYAITGVLLPLRVSRLLQQRLTTPTEPDPCPPPPS